MANQEQIVRKLDRLAGEYQKTFGDTFPVFACPGTDEEKIQWIERCIRLKRDFWDLQRNLGLRDEPV